MINKFFLTGDTHGNFVRFKNYPAEIQNDENVAIIILGDAGLNFYLDIDDDHKKNYLSKVYNFTIYCVRGNHEARPQDIPNMKLIYDENIQGEVYVQDKWPKIRYFKDWGVYRFGEYTAVIIGGAYSVDKWYRLHMANLDEDKDNNPKETGWFANEQLNKEEMVQCIHDLSNKKVNFVFTHTCPICWEPTDTFLPMIDQSTVDKSMELFLEEAAKCFDWQIWCFGHYHKDRMERTCVQQFYRATESLDEVYDRWMNGKVEYWIPKSPNFYQTDSIREKGREEDAFKNETIV